MSFAEKDKQHHKFLVKAVRRWMSKESLNKYTTISLLSGAHDFSRLNAVKAEMLQILLLKGMRSNTSELADGFFQGMPNLKVLHLSCMTLEPQLPASIVELKNLKTLQLEQCKLGDISLMCMLIELVVVSLRDSSMEELPVDMGMLINLRILDMGGCRFKSHTNTKVIARLSSLEGLYLFHKFHEWATNHEFYELPHLSSLEVGYLIDQNNYNLIQLPLSRFFEHLDTFSIVFAKDDTALEGLLNTASPLQHRALQFMVSFWESANLLDIQALKESFCIIEALLKRTEYLIFRNTNLKKNLVPMLDKDGFMDLKHLEVTNCEGMECVINTDINGSNNLIAFQNLEYLNLYNMEGLKMICKGNAPPDSRMFSNLRHLELICNSTLEYALPLDLLPKNLTEIKISDCSGLKFIFNDNDSNGSEHNENIVIDLPRLKLLYLGSRDLVSLVGPIAKVDALFNTKINCPSLELLELYSCSTIMYLWSKELDVSSFRNLKEISISCCMGLQSLGPASVLCALVKLESMTVYSCEGLQTIITEETEEEKTIEFRQLRELKLGPLDSLKSFYGGSYRVKFPKPKKLEMLVLPKMTTFVGSVGPSTTLFSDKVEFPCLEELGVLRVIKDTNMQLWNWDRAVKDEDAPKLRKVKIDSIKGLRSIPNIISANIYSLLLGNVNKMNTDKVLFSLSTSKSEEEVVQLPKLEELYVERFPRLKTLFESEDNDMLATYCRQLKQLTLEALPELSPIPLHYFKNLRSLEIITLNWKYLFPSDVVARGLEMLEELKIEDCEKLEVVIRDDEEEGGDNDRVVMFPRLKTMELWFLNIDNFSTRSYSTLHFSSLETLLIYKCSKLEAFWSGPGPFVAPKLKQLVISYCKYMKWFISGELTQIVELLSLQQVQIDDAPFMKSFSATPLKAPKLREVSISSCGDMDWILPGYPNHDDVLDLPSLEILGIIESKLQTFSTGALKAPKLTHALINGRNFDIGESEFKQFLEGYKPKKVYTLKFNLVNLVADYIVFIR
ncbi:unnamed protein product [Amaranthus hypochondriacus]